MWFKSKPDQTTKDQSELISVITQMCINWYKVQYIAIKDKEPNSTALYNLATFHFGALNTALGRDRFERFLTPDPGQQFACAIVDLAVGIEVLTGADILNTLRTRFLTALTTNYAIDAEFLQKLRYEYPHIWLIPFIQELWRQQTGS